ncbi:uncharacterized protein TNCV_4004411 [Trichonephila clavipes]|nr:uncharacterized protein TNCV_4004411 [Trichonephila clavipes]
MEDKEASNSKETQTKKARRVCHYNVDWKLRFVWLNKCDEDNRKGYCKLCKNSFTAACDGLKAVTHHAEAKEHKECESAAAMSHRMKSFFTPKGSAQSEKVGIAELTEVYHGIKRHISYVPQDCSLKVLKQVISDSDIVKQMTGGRTKCTALVNQVLFPYSMELVHEDLKNDVPFSVATDASNKGNRNFFQLLFNFYEDSFEDSTSIKERLCEVMDKSRLPWSRVTAYGADNASVNFGVNNSVFQKLKSEENNDIIAAHCNDHIFHNCAKNALKVMPVDVENIVMKVFAEFSCSAKKREDLKECFDFFESEYREVIRHVPTRWLSLCKALDRMLSSWGPLKRYFIERGSDNCPTALWAILSDQENEISGEANPTYNELYLYFIHNFMASFQEIILLVEKHTTAAFNLHNIMVKFHDTISKKINDKYFGIKVHVALKKGHLPDHEVEKFTKNATNAYHRALAYIEKWYPFENQYYKTFSCLNLECGRLPTLDQLLELWSISPWKQQTPPEQIYDELAALQSVFPSLKLEGNSIEMWCKFFQKEEAPNLLKILQFVCSVPVSNAFVEHMFSVFD